jgi:tetratricopeptide (TPR) repeat protein
LELSSLYESEGRIADAEALLKQALAIQETAFGAESPEVADGLDALARLYQAAGRYGEAEPPLKRALSIRKAVYGKRHDKVVETMQALAGLYQAAGRKDEAEALFDAAQQLQPKVKRRFAFRRAEPSYAVLKVYYATDRKNTGATDPTEVYAGDRGPLTLGTATVSIPRDHRMGAVETPSIWRLEWCNDPERFVVLLSVDETDKAQFFKDVSARVKKSAGKSAFIFVHGYNVTFTDAARRTARRWPTISASTARRCSIAGRPRQATPPTKWTRPTPSGRGSTSRPS